KSSWYVGFTPQLATAVGMYREKDGKPASLNGLGGEAQVFGGTFAVFIWNEFMEAALAGLEEKDFPEPAYGGESAVRDPEPQASVEPSDGAVPAPLPTSTPTLTPTAPDPNQPLPNPDPSLIPGTAKPTNPTPIPTPTMTGGRPNPGGPTPTSTPTRTRPAGNGNGNPNQGPPGG
ncbi:MAG: hypothetical protein ACRC0L_09870, partial [Angustibacter sp.]